MSAHKLYILLLLPLFLVCNSKSDTSKNNGPARFVIDSADVFLPPQLAHLDSMYTSLKVKTGNVIRLLTIRDFKPAESLDAYALNYYTGCSFGNDTTANRLLIVFCASCHSVQILLGKRKEKILDYSSLTAIINDVMIPEFSASHDYIGILKGSDTIITRLEKAKN